ncbi:pilus assembly protein HofM [Leminorella grimontii]|uniref:Pilus assembly protein HofM n=1 Tax=Leminorella grimontii TaxID=82981 RepID=A0AAV5N093_9GAMM|nr:pilus assembly protein PilM [Leminorella grimontii]KFC93766.1 PilM family type IV pilus biogenesis protein [Leminorella grimontii ATCC 33999 = DSM 5078]GKX55536.1 pilus assembly protein HofM [Leminorella grimontii]VFS55663.1 type IV pilus assembly protein PilM [Leminorella grimontii]
MTIWQAGIDIHSAGFYAVILQRQRYGWQMRNWHLWRAPPLPEGYAYPSQSDGISQALLQALKAWRSRLPKRVSFRIALPAEAILQQTLPLPDGVESPSARQWLIEDSVDRLFPLSLRELAVDYRVISSLDGKANAQAVVSATRRKDMTSLLSGLAEAGIAPDIVDAAPCVLRSMALAAGVDRGALLLHRMARRFMWVSPLNDAFCYQLLPEMSDESPLFSASQAREAYRLAGGDAQRVLLSGEIDEPEAQGGAALWSPLAAIDQMHPPLPPEEHRFVLACGLALREEDR